MAADFYRGLLRRLAGLAAGRRHRIWPGPSSRRGRRARPTPDAAAASLERTLEAAEQVDRNANQATLIEAWLDDLAGAGRRVVMARRGAIR